MADRVGGVIGRLRQAAAPGADPESDADLLGRFVDRADGETVPTGYTVTPVVRLAEEDRLRATVEFQKGVAGEDHSTVVTTVVRLSARAITVDLVGCGAAVTTDWLDLTATRATD